MKIPSKIDKRTFTRLSKQNYKYLTGEIADQHSDLMIEAAIFNDYPHVVDDVIYLETIAVYNKSVKQAFKEFKRDKKKLLAAHAKFNASKK